MDSVMSWAVITIISLGGIAWLLIARMRWLDVIHPIKKSCVWANAGHKKDWQQFATGHYTR